MRNYRAKFSYEADGDRNLDEIVDILRDLSDDMDAVFVLAEHTPAAGLIQEAINQLYSAAGLRMKSVRSIARKNAARSRAARRIRRGPDGARTLKPQRSLYDY